MKRLLIFGGGILIIGVLLYSCVYHQITHMNNEELEWATNRYEGEIMYLKSQDGNVDTVTIKEISIHNSLNPINWGYFNTSNKDYIATADVRYNLNSKKGGVLHIEKRSNRRPICFSSILDNGWLYDIPLNTTSLQIGSVTMNDIMFFENEKSEVINRKDSNAIISYSWSKMYGLVQYTLQDGTIFSRVAKE